MSKVIIDLYNIYNNLKDIPKKNQNLYLKKNDEMDAIVNALNSLRPLLEKNKLIN